MNEHQRVCRAACTDPDLVLMLMAAREGGGPLILALYDMEAALRGAGILREAGLIEAITSSDVRLTVGGKALLREEWMSQ
jgi:hypothetical protein